MTCPNCRMSPRTRRRALPRRQPSRTPDPIVTIPRSHITGPRRRKLARRRGHGLCKKRRTPPFRSLRRIWPQMTGSASPTPSSIYSTTQENCAPASGLQPPALYLCTIRSSAGRTRVRPPPLSKPTLVLLDVIRPSPRPRTHGPRLAIWPATALPRRPPPRRLAPRGGRGGAPPRPPTPPPPSMWPKLYSASVTTGSRPTLPPA